MVRRIAIHSVLWRPRRKETKSQARKTWSNELGSCLKTLKSLRPMSKVRRRCTPTRRSSRNRKPLPTLDAQKTLQSSLWTESSRRGRAWRSASRRSITWLCTTRSTRSESSQQRTACRQNISIWPCSSVQRTWSSQTPARTTSISSTIRRVKCSIQRARSPRQRATIYRCTSRSRESVAAQPTTKAVTARSELTSIRSTSKKTTTN